MMHALCSPLCLVCPYCWCSLCMLEFPVHNSDVSAREKSCVTSLLIWSKCSSPVLGSSLELSVLRLFFDHSVLTEPLAAVTCLEWLT
jgi:hypothetical protein